MLADQLLGDEQYANMILVGAAIQAGALPLSIAAVEQAITLNGAAVAANIQALRRGRQAIADPNGLLSPVEGSSKKVTIHGNGFPINGSPALIINATNGWAAFQFDPVNRVWITFVGNIP